VPLRDRTPTVDIAGLDTQHRSVVEHRQGIRTHSTLAVDLDEFDVVAAETDKRHRAQ